MNTREFIDDWLANKGKPNIGVRKYHHITCNGYHLWHYHTCIARWWTLNNGKKVLFINNTYHSNNTKKVQNYLVDICKQKNIIYFCLYNIPLNSFYLNDYIDKFIAECPTNIQTL